MRASFAGRSAPRPRLVLLLAALAVVAMASGCAEEAGAPESSPVPDGNGDSGPPPTVSGDTQNVNVVVDGEFILNGRLFAPDQDVGVIFAHMQPNDKTAWLGYAEELSQQGYAALAFDFRGYGESEGDEDFEKLDEDLTAWINYLRGPPFNIQTVFLVGASMGGTTSLVVAAQQDVAGVVAVSAPSQFEDQDALSVVGQITEPKLFIASEDVEADMISLDELFAAASEPKEQQVYPGNAHGTELLEADQAAAFKQRVLQFLEANQ